MVGRRGDFDHPSLRRWWRGRNQRRIALGRWRGERRGFGSRRTGRRLHGLHPGAGLHPLGLGGGGCDAGSELVRGQLAVPVPVSFLKGGFGLLLGKLGLRAHKFRQGDFSIPVGVEVGQRRGAMTALVALFPAGVPVGGRGCGESLPGSGSRGCLRQAGRWSLRGWSAGRLRAQGGKSWQGQPEHDNKRFHMREG